MLMISVSILLCACVEPAPTPEEELAELERILDMTEVKANTQTALGLTSPMDPQLVAEVNQRRAALGLPPRKPFVSSRPSPTQSYAVPPVNRERYARIESNPVQRVTTQPISTFSIDVDTASYSNVRRLLEAGNLPPTDAVRVEEFINYFDYSYALPESAAEPFLVHTEAGPAPWNSDTHLLHIGIKGYGVEWHDAPPANLVFLIDVSGSMATPEKLPLVKKSLQLLTRQLRPQDKVAIVVYAGAAGLVLPATTGDRKGHITAAITALEAGGSTNGGEGIRLAYRLAADSFVAGGINRVIIATDGDMNVGVVDVEDLKDLVARNRDTGISLTTLGFGSGNYNSELMESLADIGNGNAAYIDNLVEAHRVLVRNMASTMLTIAEDVKVQVEFSPLVAEYRLIGYENRLLDEADFTNDKVDAGDIGAGHSVTALYEVALRGSEGVRLPERRYGSADTTQVQDTLSELAFVKLRYKRPGSVRSVQMSTPILAGDIKDTVAETSDDFRFAAAAAAFGQQLRGGTYLGEFGYSDIRTLAAGARGQDLHGDRNALLALAHLAESLMSPGGETPFAVLSAQ
jgi:Ca-activated chloride channel family protein|tara:strand:- start:1700 stop:3421 length:1722 start_codon:yes stop_codon:yes gene_type:complete